MSTSAELRLPQDASLLMRIDVPLERYLTDIPRLPVSLTYVEWSEAGQLSEGLLGHGFASSSLNFVVSHGCHEHVLSQLIPVRVIACAIDVVSEGLLWLNKLELIGEKDWVDSLDDISWFSH